jgi:DNA-binding transcriptional LysR family regulator
MNALPKSRPADETISWMKSPIDSQQLQAFAILARNGSFTQTARELFLTQSAISHSIKALESDVGCRLLDRVGRKVTLTQAGEHLLKHAERVLAELRSAREGLEELGRWGHGRLRIGAPVTVCQYLLPAVLREFKESFPHCHLSIEPGDSREVLEAVDQRRVDLAVTLEPQGEDQLQFIPLFSDDMGFVVSPLHPWAQVGKVTRAEIPTQNFIVYRRASRTWRMIESYFREEEIVLNAVIELGAMDAIKELVKVGLGVSVLATWVARKELLEQSLVTLPVGRRRLRRNWGIVHWMGRRLTLAEETFIGLCRSATEGWEDQPSSEG